MRGEVPNLGQFSTLGDRFDDLRRKKCPSDEAGNVAISHALAAGDRGQRSRLGGNEFLEPLMGPCDRFEQRSIRLARRCVCASDYEPHFHTPALHSHREELRNRQHRRRTVGSIDWQREVDRKLDAARFQIYLVDQPAQRCRAIRTGATGSIRLPLPARRKYRLRQRRVGGIGYSRPTTRFWVVQSNGRSTCGVSFRSASSPRSAIASTIFGARNASRMRRAT